MLSIRPGRGVGSVDQSIVQPRLGDHRIPLARCKWAIGGSVHYDMPSEHNPDRETSRIIKPKRHNAHLPVPLYSEQPVADHPPVGRSREYV